MGHQAIQFLAHIGLGGQQGRLLQHTFLGQGGGAVKNIGHLLLQPGFQRRRLQGGQFAGAFRQRGDAINLGADNVVQALPFRLAVGGQ